MQDMTRRAWILIAKRLVVWFVETSSVALLLGLVLAVLLGYDQHAFLKDVSIYAAGIALLFLSTGYLLTTIVVRTLWRGRPLWSYSAIATALFLFHFEIMNVSLGGAFDPSDRVRIRAAGACIAFACTFGGTLVLRKWAAEIPAG